MLRCLARLCPLARSLFANGLHTPLYFSQVAGYGCACSLFWIVFEWHDTAVSGTRVFSLSQLVACTRCCVLGVLDTAVSYLSFMF